MLGGFVAPGQIVFDCGANLGLYCRFLGGVLGAGRIVAFEPEPTNLPFLERNLRLGGLGEKVAVLPIALSDEDGSAEFEVDDKQSTSGTLARVSGGKAAEGRRNLGLAPLVRSVEVRRIDSLLASGVVPEPDVIKVDVEGAEAMLLRGAEALLASRAPDLVVELHGEQVSREVLSLLRAHGYSMIAEVSPTVDPSGWSRLEAGAETLIQHRYDVRFIAASRSPVRVARVEEALRT